VKRADEGRERLLRLPPDPVLSARDRVQRRGRDGEHRPSRYAVDVRHRPPGFHRSGGSGELADDVVRRQAGPHPAAHAPRRATRLEHARGEHLLAVAQVRLRFLGQLLVAQRRTPLMPDAT
jgi:hypothetical protein